MNCQQANALCIVDFLASAGFKPEKSRTGHALYRSPLREEKTASFKVDTRKNLWYDHGAGTGGRLVDLVQAMHGVELPDALRIIAGTSTSAAPFQPPKQPSTPQASGVLITRVESLTHPALLTYCESRGIPSDVAQANLQEASFRVNGGPEQFALAFRNNSGGYELRNNNPAYRTAGKQGFMSCVGRKDFTLLASGAPDVVSVFEGFFDYLSALVVSGKAQPSHHVLVLNSVAQLKRALPQLASYKTINLYLDNDPAGKDGVKTIQAQFSGAADKSKTYEAHNDFNDYLISHRKLWRTP
jgi:hypothetical protein